MGNWGGNNLLNLTLLTVNCVSTSTCFFYTVTTRTILTISLEDIVSLLLSPIGHTERIVGHCDEFCTLKTPNRCC